VNARAAQNAIKIPNFNAAAIKKCLQREFATRKLGAGLFTRAFELKIKTAPRGGKLSPPHKSSIPKRDRAKKLSLEPFPVRE
jgi:hypothetical protein